MPLPRWRSAHPILVKGVGLGGHLRQDFRDTVRVPATPTTYIELSKDELENLTLESTRTIDINEFVPKSKLIRSRMLRGDLISAKRNGKATSPAQARNSSTSWRR